MRKQDPINSNLEAQTRSQETDFRRPKPETKKQESGNKKRNK